MMSCAAWPQGGATRVGVDSQAPHAIRYNNPFSKQSLPHQITRGQYFLTTMTLVEAAHMSAVKVALCGSDEGKHNELLVGLYQQHLL